MKIHVIPAVVALLLASGAARAAEEPDLPQTEDHGDLFPRTGHLTAAAATGLPFLGIAEVGGAATSWFAIGIVGGITPSVVTAGIRPRFRIATSTTTALVLNAPMLYYPKASAPGPGGIEATSWVLTRPELFFDVQTSAKWHVAGGMGIVAAASIDAMGNALQGKDFAMPAYGADPNAKKGFAGGVWNTVATRESYAIGRDTHLFAEGSIILEGVRPANNVGGPPIVVTTGVQHAF